MKNEVDMKLYILFIYYILVIIVDIEYFKSDFGIFYEL